jgi:hypothetical protein
VLVCGPPFWVGSRFLDRFWSFLVVFGSPIIVVLRFYLTFQFLSGPPAVLFSPDGRNTVRTIFVRQSDHPFGWI